MAEITHPKQLGQSSEAAVLHEFVRRGYPVLEPFGDNERYDLVVEVADEFYKVQVKTGRHENGRVQFETRSTGTLTRTVKKEGYMGQIDIFAVYEPGLDKLYIIPVAEAPGTSMGLRVEQPEKPSPNINWADDYTVESWLSSVE